MAEFYFPRKALAQEIAQAILSSTASFRGKATLSPQPGSGTFLSAQRRQGKTSFILNDLKPVLEERGLLVIYIDLWADLTINPQELLFDAIDQAQAVASSKGSWLSKTVSKSTKAVDSIGIPGIASIKMKQSTKTWRKPTLAQTFQDIHKARQVASKKITDDRIVLIVDEAQQALATASGTALIFALKAARDALNLTASQPNLLMIFTGSDRSKLASLLSTKTQPFYGASIRDFPVLGADFCMAVAKHFNSLLRQDRQFSANAIVESFDALNHKPESLMDAISDTLRMEDAIDNGLQEAASMDALLKQRVSLLRTGTFATLSATFNGLTPLQQAVFWGVLKGGPAFAPFSEDARLRYSKHLKQKGIVSAANAQNGLSALVAQGLLWKPLRGGYQVDDLIWAEWAEAVVVEIAAMRKAK